MSRQQQIRSLEYGNRTLIAVLSLAGMLLDGSHLADFVLQAAVVLWLWSPELRALELRLLRRARMLADSRP